MALIYYHVDWPGDDPMNQDNPTEVNTQATLYGVNDPNTGGVPWSQLDGVHSSSTPTQTNINTNYAVTSPFTISMIHEVSNGVIAVKMVIKKTATTTGTYAAKIAVIEENMNYQGTYGTADHINVFKKFLPDPNGMTLPTMAVGDSVVYIKSWTYANVDNSANLAAVGYIQDASSKAVQQAGMSTAGAIPASADFAASMTKLACVSSQISFSDQSYKATSWLWDFGDGSTSTLQNPTHTYSASGNYTVTLKINNNSAYTTTKTNFISVTVPTAPSTTGGSGNVGSTVTLSASGSGVLKWYTAQTGGTAIAKGNSYTTPPLSTTTNYYVEDVIGNAVQSVGMTAKGTAGGYYTAAARQGLTFDTYTPVTIKSVTVYEQTAGTRTIWLRNSNGTYLDSVKTSVSTGTQSVTLNFHVPAGTGYVLGAGVSNYFWRETSGPAYPYTLANVLSVTGSTAGSSYYYYFYNWQVQSDSCISPRAIVTADILTGIEDYSKNIITVYPNPNNGSFTVSIDNPEKYNELSISNVVGQTIISENLVNNKYEKTFDFSDLPKGIYMIKLSGENTNFYKKIIIR
ncbi:MAG TPA: PKD domain-containing protein [Bacteroidales bacterium]|nr:PKD domain-containing protein [Bacteroidales bacterium]HPS15803.1 PKD domain-containing protein [Bacteroidales bacterium]